MSESGVPWPNLFGHAAFFRRPSTCPRSVGMAPSEPHHKNLPDKWWGSLRSTHPTVAGDLSARRAGFSLGIPNRRPHPSVTKKRPTDAAAVSASCWGRVGFPRGNVEFGVPASSLTLAVRLGRFYNACFPPPRAGKGDRHLLCEAPGGPFRQKVPVPFSLPRDSFHRSERT